MNSISTESVRKNIIIENDTLYLDFTASGLAYKPIEDKILQLLKTYANTHSRVGKNANATTLAYARARESLRKTLAIGDDAYILPTGTGATGAIKKLQEILGLYIPPATRKRYNVSINSKPLVIVGPFEHHSNELSWREALCDTVRIRLNTYGAIDLNHLAELLNKHKNREIIGTFSAASNVTGLLNPIEEIYKLIKEYDGIMCVDAAALSAHANVSAKFYDALFLSPHKLIGGPGSCGLLVIKKDLYDKSLPPTFAAGGTVSYVSRSDHFYEDNVEVREDAGTPGILQLVRASLAYELRNLIGIKAIQEEEEMLHKLILQNLSKLEGVEIYSHKTLPSLPIFAFNIIGLSPYVVTKHLSDEFGIQTRAGCSCAGPYGHDLLGLEDSNDTKINKGSYKEFGWVRASFSYIHTEKDIKYFINALKSII